MDDLRFETRNGDRVVRAAWRVPPSILLQVVRQCGVERVALGPDGRALIHLRGTMDDLATLRDCLAAAQRAVTDIGLTARQKEILGFCIARGYYTIPRRSTLRVLAGELGISTTSLSLALRRAESKIVLSYARRAPVPSPAVPPAASAHLGPATRPLAAGGQPRDEDELTSSPLISRD